jgi:hypothetical protein
VSLGGLGGVGVDLMHEKLAIGATILGHFLCLEMRKSRCYEREVSRCEYIQLHIHFVSYRVQKLFQCMIMLYIFEFFYRLS